MKKTIKQWCKEHEVNWLGQGQTGPVRYDWKLVLGKGRAALFACTVKGPQPELHRVGKREVLVFPNVNRPKDGGKITESAFLCILNWVDDCLNGDIRELTSANNHLNATSERPRFACLSLAH